MCVGSATRWPNNPCNNPRMEREEPLLGGNRTEQVVKIGQAVHRSRGRNSDFVATLLTTLERQGFPFAPKYFGRDDEGRDVFSYLDGVTTEHPKQRSEAAYQQAGRMLRLLHDETAGSGLAGGAECVIHGDPGPFNTIFRSGMPVAFIDWDSARPGSRVEDLAYMAWTWCIFSDPRIPVDEQASRLNALRLGYGFASGPQLLDAVLACQAAVMNSMEVSGGPAAPGPTSPRRPSPRQRDAVEWAAGDRRFLQPAMF